MNFAFYKLCSREHEDGKLSIFKSGKAHIESVLKVTYAERPGLHQPLRDWATKILGSDPFGSTKQEEKWKFISLGSEGFGAFDEFQLNSISVTALGGQGYVSDVEERKALEEAAMDAAEQYFKSEGFSVVRKGKPYDLLCTRGGELLHVEVKGTKSTGDKVFLTAGEVEFAREYKQSMALFVLHSIDVVRSATDLRAEGGESLLILPWDVDEGVLRPTEYEYRLPVRGADRN